MAGHIHELKNTHGSGQKTLQSYLYGFGICVVLTIIAFGLVESRVLSDSLTFTALAALAIAQLFVQSVCFLRLNFSKEGQWNALPYIFTLLIIAILVGGSLWIMYNLNYNMFH